MGPSIIQLLIVVLIALLVFKGKELPSLLAGLGKGLGQGLAHFRDAVSLKGNETATTVEPFTLPISAQHKEPI